MLAKAKLNTVVVFICRALGDSYINFDEFLLVNNVLREYGDMREAIKNIKSLESSSKILIYSQNNVNILFEK